MRIYGYELGAVVAVEKGYGGGRGFAKFIFRSVVSLTLHPLDSLPSTPFPPPATRISTRPPLLFRRSLDFLSNSRPGDRLGRIQSATPVDVRGRKVTASGGGGGGSEESI